MNKPSKRDTSLCEQDALADMRLTERMLLHAYADAAGRGPNSLRQALAELFSEAAEDVQTVLAAEDNGAEQEERSFAESLRARFGQEKKKLKACTPQEE